MMAPPSDLKNKTVSGLLWSFLDNFSIALISFVVGIVLARLLSPEDYGLIGMTVIFISFSMIFVNSGFSQALIRKKDCTNEDFSTVFYFNIVVGFIFFLIIYFSAENIGNFFDESRLVPLVKVLALVLVIDSFQSVQNTQLVKNLNFKLLMKISLASTLFSSTIALYMAFNDFGVWSLVAAKVAYSLIGAILLWLLNRWHPSLIFSVKSFREMFNFGSKLMLSSVLDTGYRNIYYLVIGKYYTATDLGYFTKAQTFTNMPSENISNVIGRVSYPTLSLIQDDIPSLRQKYKILIRCTMYITFVLMLGLAAIAEPLIITLIGEKWRAMVIYLQLLCFVGMFYPLHALNLNMLKVQGRSDLFLKIEVIKKILAIPTIIIGIYFGIIYLILGMIINSLIALYVNSYWSGKLIGYSFLGQFKDIFPSFMLAFTVNIVVFSFGYVFKFDNYILLLLQLSIGIILTITLSEITRFRDYLYIKDIIKEKLINR